MTPGIPESRKSVLFPGRAVNHVTKRVTACSGSRFARVLTGLALILGVCGPDAHGASRTAPLPKKAALEAKGPRTPWKCGQALYAAAERAKAAGIPRVRMPRGCADAAIEAPYRGEAALGGVRLYRGATDLGMIEDSGPRAPAPPTTLPMRVRKRTITRQFYTRHPTLGVRMHVTEVVEEE